jgi:DNA adenine methylase
MSVKNPVLRYHGAKFRLAKWVMQFFPEHTCYVEPYGGAAGVLLQKPRVYAEVYNDLDRAVVNFFTVIRDPESRARLIESLVLTPYSRHEFELAWEPTQDHIEEARRLAIRAQMGFGSAGATKGITGFRIDTGRKYGTAQHLWATFPHAIAEAGQRLSAVLIENRPALEVIAQHDSPSTLHFVDPPYVLGTRELQASGRGYYKHEMTDEDHAELLSKLLNIEGFVVVTGYKSDLYADFLKGWEQLTTKSRISAQRGTALRDEIAWLNPACSAALELERTQRRMFA